MHMIVTYNHSEQGSKTRKSNNGWQTLQLNHTEREFWHFCWAIRGLVVNECSKNDSWLTYGDNLGTNYLSDGFESLLGKLLTSALQKKKRSSTRANWIALLFLRKKKAKQRKLESFH